MWSSTISFKCFEECTHAAIFLNVQLQQLHSWHCFNLLDAVVFYVINILCAWFIRVLNIKKWRNSDKILMRNNTVLHHYSKNVGWINMSFLWHSSFLPVIKNNKTGKLGNITIVPYIFLQTLMRIYSYLRNRVLRNYLIPTLIRTRAWPLFFTKDKTSRPASVTPS